MKRLTASEARKQWFRLLDDVAAGEVVVLERKGRRLVLHREDSKSETVERNLPDYRKLLRAPNADRADQWSWNWQGPEQELALVTRRKR